MKPGAPVAAIKILAQAAATHFPSRHPNATASGSSLDSLTQSFHRMRVEIVFRGQKPIQHKHSLSVQFNDLCSHA